MVRIGNAHIRVLTFSFVSKVLVRERFIDQRRCIARLRARRCRLFRSAETLGFSRRSGIVLA